jgi:hypothetical protein
MTHTLSHRVTSEPRVASGQEVGPTITAALDDGPLRGARTRSSIACRSSAAQASASGGAVRQVAARRPSPPLPLLDFHKGRTESSFCLSPDAFLSLSPKRSERLEARQLARAAPSNRFRVVRSDPPWPRLRPSMFSDPYLSLSLVVHSNARPGMSDGGVRPALLRPHLTRSPVLALRRPPGTQREGTRLT